MSQFPEFDLYDTLHLPKDASPADVRANYVRIIRRNHFDHPDFLDRIRRRFPRQPDEREAAHDQRIMEIATDWVQRFNIAYTILSNPVERSAYDRYIGVSAPPKTVPKPAKPATKTEAETPRATSGEAPHKASCQALHKATSEATPKAVSPESENRQFFKRGSRSAPKKPRRLSPNSANGRDNFGVWKR